MSDVGLQKLEQRLLNWWPILVVLVGIVIAGAEARAQITALKETSELQAAKISALESSMANISLTLGRVDERTARIPAIEDKMDKLAGHTDAH